MAEGRLTQAERLTRIETLLSGWLDTRKEDRREWAYELKNINDRLDKINERHEKLISRHEELTERLAEYENKGKGVLIGAGIAGGSLVGASAAFWDKIKAMFTAGF